ncbi:MAG: hypothetical protein M3Q23_08565 [Actinomycetota bacterium]|nr:hypothetical protein [Actinomycetota bacterium]
METDNSDDAERHAVSAFSEVLQALHTIADEPYHVEALKVLSPSGKGGVASPWTMGHMIEISAMPTDLARLAVQRHERLVRSRVARTAADYISRGVSLSIGISELSSSILLNYYMAIEGISNHIMMKAKKGDDPAVRTELDQQVRILIEALEGQDTNAAVQMIRETAKSFDRIELRYMDLKIGEAGRILGIDSAFVAQAQDFNHFRSEYLGHFRSEIPTGEFSRWFEDETAFRLGNKFLAAFVDRFA